MSAAWLCHWHWLTICSLLTSMRTCACVACTYVCMWDCEIEGTRKRAMIKFEVSGMVSIVSSVCDPLPMQIPRVRIQKRPLRWKFLQQHVLWKAWPVDYIIAIKSVFDSSLLSNLEGKKNPKQPLPTEWLNTHWHKVHECSYHRAQGKQQRWLVFLNQASCDTWCYATWWIRPINS